MAKKSFFQGAVILGIAGIVIKILGAFFRIPLGNIIGGEGMGYYQIAYPVYVLFLTITTAGIPTAISKLVAERTAVNDHYEAHRVFRVSFLLLFVVGVVSSSILFFGAKPIVTMMGLPKAEYCMMAIAPALLVVALMAAYRGYFQGMQDMKPTAGSQIAEQFCRVAVGLSLSILLLGKGLPFAAAGASFGATAGAIGGLLWIVFIYMKKRRKIHKEISRGVRTFRESSGKILARIFIIAIPITIGTSIMPIMNAIDGMVVVRRLIGIGYSHPAASELYGQLSGFAAPLINLPQVLTQAIAMSLVPAIAVAFQKKDREFLNYNVDLGLRTAMIIAAPCAFGFFFLAHPIMYLLYPLKRASAEGAAVNLLILAFGVIFLALSQTLSAVLQGIGKQHLPVRNLFIGALIKLILTVWLTGIPSVNVHGAAVGTVAAYGVAALLNLCSVMKHTKAHLHFGMVFGKPFLSAFIMGLLAWGTHRVLQGFTGGTLATLAAVAVGGCAYVVMLLLSNGITSDEIRMLPKGKKIAAKLEKLQKKR